MFIPGIPAVLNSFRNSDPVPVHEENGARFISQGLIFLCGIGLADQTCKSSIVREPVIMNDLTAGFHGEDGLHEGEQRILLLSQNLGDLVIVRHAVRMPLC